MDDDELLQAQVDDFTDDSEMDGESERAKKSQLTLQLNKGESEDEGVARASLAPEYNAAQSICQLGQILAFKEVDITELAKRLNHETQRLKDGDLGQAESTLSAQACTLDALFHNLLRRSALNYRNEFSVIERLIKLAMKAQSQCRTTLDSLASMKKPPSEIIKQTNIAHGHQQVNNFPEKEIPPNGLLENNEHEPDKWLDRGAPKEAIRVDSDLATVGEQHRAKNA